MDAVPNRYVLLLWSDTSEGPALVYQCRACRNVTSDLRAHDQSHEGGGKVREGIRPADAVGRIVVLT